MLNSYLELNFEVIKKVDNSRYANGDDLKLANLGRIALFSNLELTTSSEKHLEDISHAHIVFRMYKLITIAKETDDLSIGFDHNRNRRPNELTINKNMKVKLHATIMLKDVLGFAEHQEKATYSVGYKSTPTRNKDDAALQNLWH